MRANFRTRQGELDLVMRQGRTVVFVEVKSRGGEAFGRPEEFVTAAKQRRIVKAALEFLKGEKLTSAPLRFDVVSIGPRGLEHIENAFGVAPGSYTL